MLQGSGFERVGGTQTIKVNVRVIAATNRDLAADVSSGKFRADLYYRLSVFPISVPPLRDRATDIPLLASYFVTQLAPALGKKIDQIDGMALQRLMRYPWPGNIRELRNVLERAVILSEGGTLRFEDRDLPAGAAPAGVQTLEEVERAHIEEVLKRTDGVIGGETGAAKILGVPPSTLRSTMDRLGMKR